MEKNKLQIELNNHPYSKDVIYAAISLRGGYATHNYIIDGDVHFVSNCAFYNVLFNYYKSLDEVLGLHFNVEGAVATVSFCRKKTEFMPVLKSILNTLFNKEYDLEKFEVAKQVCKDAFAMRYKNGAFRAKLKGHEFSDLNKRFTLKQLIEDIDKITYEEFVENAKVLIVPDNMCIYIMGEISELDFSSLCLEKFEELFMHTVRIAGFDFDAYLRQEAHVTNIARDDYNLIIESIDFMNKEITNFTKLLITEILAEQLPVHEVEVWVDSLDASIMFASEKLCSYKKMLRFEDEKSYELAKRRLIEKYAVLLENLPEHFAIKASNLMIVGIYIDQYLDFLDKSSYELFSEICDKSDYKITEAQIVLRKESR